MTEKTFDAEVTEFSLDCEKGRLSITQCSQRGLSLCERVDDLSATEKQKSDIRKRIVQGIIIGHSPHDSSMSDPEDTLPYVPN